MLLGFKVDPIGLMGSGVNPNPSKTAAAAAATAAAPLQASQPAQLAGDELDPPAAGLAAGGGHTERGRER